MAGRVACIRSSKTPCVVKYGEYVVAVEHVLEVFSSSVTIEFKYLHISSCISICTLAC
jgi:hypothetical protein